MIGLTERISLGIDEGQRRVAESTARKLKTRTSAPRIGTVATADPSTVKLLERQYERRRESLLTRFGFTAVASAVATTGDRLFIVPDHGDLLAPDFQFSVNPDAVEMFRETTTLLTEFYDPWSVWATWVGNHPALGGKSPASFVTSEAVTANELETIRTRLIGLLPTNEPN